MIVVMKKGATNEEIQHMIRQVERLGLKAHPIYRHGADRHCRHRRETRRVPAVAGERARRGRGGAHPGPLQGRQPRGQGRADRGPRRQPGRGQQPRRHDRRAVFGGGRGADRSPRRGRSRPPAPRPSAAGPSNPAPAPTVSRASRKRACESWPPPGKKPAWRSSPK